MCFNADKLRGLIVERLKTQEVIANELNIDRATFYRKMKNGKFTIGEAQLIRESVPLTDAEAMEIFFGITVA